MSSTINVIQLANEGCEIVFEEKQILSAYAKQLIFPKEATELLHIKNDSRKVEFLGVRKLRNFCQIKSAIYYDRARKPYLDSNIKTEVSISHSRNYCAFAHGKQAIGLDIEEINGRILKVSSKFMNEEESSIIHSADIIELTKLWCMKEAMFKLNSRTGIDFKTELLVTKKLDMAYFGKMLCEDTWRKTKMHCFQFNELILCLCHFDHESD